MVIEAFYRGSHYKHRPKPADGIQSLQCLLSKMAATVPHWMAAPIWKHSIGLMFPRKWHMRCSVRILRKIYNFTFFRPFLCRMGWDLPLTRWPGYSVPPIHLRRLVRYHSRLLIDGLIDWPQKYLHILDVHMCILECRIKHSSAEKTTNSLGKCLDEARDQDSNERDRDQDQGSDPQDQDRAGKKIVSRRDSVRDFPSLLNFS